MAVALFDTMIALLAGLAIFPVIFASNLEPASGPGLFFIGMPYVFGNIGQGDLFGSLFFVLVGVVSLGSCVAFMEPVVGAVMQQLRISRPVAALLVGLLVWLLAFVVAAPPTASPPDSEWFGYGSLLALLDWITASLLLPLVALLTAVFVGWRMRPEIARHQLGRESDRFFSLWRWLLRYIAPLAIGLILLMALVQYGEVIS
jgi:NSS family neurotransmitter:Na+ symporter